MEEETKETEGYQMTTPLKPEDYQLLPCPFCGGEAQGGVFSVWCKNDKCRVSITDHGLDDSHLKQWNTRTLAASSEPQTMDAPDCGELDEAIKEWEDLRTEDGFPKDLEIILAAAKAHRAQETMQEFNPIRANSPQLEITDEAVEAGATALYESPIDKRKFEPPYTPTEENGK